MRKAGKNVVISKATHRYASCKLGPSNIFLWCLTNRAPSPVHMSDGFQLLQLHADADGKLFVLKHTRVQYSAQLKRLTGNHLKNSNLLGLLSDLLVIWNGTVPFLSDMRHFQVLVDTSLQSQGHEAAKREGAAAHTCSVLYLRRSAFS